MESSLDELRPAVYGRLRTLPVMTVMSALRVGKVVLPHPGAVAQNSLPGASSEKSESAKPKKTGPNDDYKA